MSSLLVGLIFFLGIIASLLTPYAALLVYEWASYLPPYLITYGPLSDLPYGKLGALAARGRSICEGEGWGER